MYRDLVQQFQKPSGVSSLLLGELLGWILGITLILGSTAIIAQYLYVHRHHIYPGLTVDGVAVGGLTPQEALTRLNNEDTLPAYTVTLEDREDPSTLVASSSSQLGLHRNYQETIAFAFAYGRTGSWWSRLQAIFHAPTKKPALKTSFSFDNSASAEFIQIFSSLVNKDGKDPYINLKQTNNPQSLAVNKGEAGKIVNPEEAWKVLAKAAVSGQDVTYKIGAVPEKKVLTPEEESQFRQRAERLVGKKIEFTAEDHSFSLSDQDLVGYLAFPNAYQEDKISQTLQEWAKKVDRPAQDAQFVLDKQTLVVQKFTPDKPGLTLPISDALTIVVNELNRQELETDSTSNSSTPLSLPLSSTPPQVRLADTNSLGISTRIGWGESTYAHSIPNRVHNVQITAERVTDIIVPPGKEFSFNKQLGEVSAATGYRSAYVIKGGRTELGDGGGVCQVSTTLFRAVLNAGLAITRRLPHSYRVGYYEQNSEPGFDATVYAGNVDFRFINDTQHHVLIHTEVDSSSQYLKVELYGTDDGRTSEIINYKKWGATPPLADEFYPDPSLAPGQKKQIDWAVGGLKTEFTQVIKDKMGNEISKHTYSSFYRPWSSKFLVGQ